MKKLILLCLAILMLFACVSLTACTPELGEGEIHIVAANFAGYDFAAEIIGRDNTRVSLTFLSAGDSHSFNPTYGDIAKIQNADLFIYVGGESDHALDSVLSGVKDGAIFKMIDCVELLAIEDSHEEDKHAHEYDEHVWTSPYHAALIVQALSEKLCQIDPDGAEEYRQNTKDYLDKLNALDADFQAMFDSVENPTLVMGDRFPFLYFANRYGFSYEAAFPSCSSASEPSPHRVIELVAFVKEKKISTVFYMESGNHSVAERIAAEGGAKTALLHSCHKVTPEEMQNGTTYLSLMQQNYTAIRTSLGLAD